MSHVYWIHLPEHTDIKTQGYVGICKSDDINVRWNRHKSEAYKIDGEPYKIYRAIRKYGKDNLIWEIIFTGPYYGCMQIEEYFRPSMNIGWNIHAGGRSQSPMQGRKHSKETCARLSEIRTGVRRSSESLLKQSNTLKGHLTPSEVREKIRQAQLGKANKGVLKKRKQVQASTGECFESLTKAAEWANIGYTSICKQLKGIYTTSGRHPVTNVQLTWTYK